MKSNIIRSEVGFRRTPAIAFFFSLFFTGLGQVYNGNFSKGLIFFILRILSLLVIPLYLFINGKDFSVFFTVPVIATHLLILIVSPLEALYAASKKNHFNLQWFNSVMFYFLYSAVFSALLVSSCLLVSGLFSIEKIYADNMNPGLIRGDFVLINKFNIKSADIGDIVRFSYGGITATGRIVAKKDEIVEIKGNDISINNTLLSYSIINKNDAEKMNIADFHDLFFEINRGKKYAVILAGEAYEEKTAIKQYIIGDDELLIASDKRIGEDLFIKTGTDMLSGIIQGIIYSKNLRKLFSKPYLPSE